MMDYHDELRTRYNPDGSDLRRAQLKMLDMLKFVDKVCQEQNITYWIESGTLLGAARHRGFIPWDDDTDICMPYDDYLRFKQYMLYHNTSTQYVLQCHQTDPHYYGTWGVLRDLQNRYVKNDKRLNSFEYQGLQVDIFPVNHISRNKTCWRITRWIFAYLVNAPMYDGRRIQYLRWNVPLSCFFLMKILIPFLHLFTRRDKKHLYYRYGMLWWRKYSVDDVFPLQRIFFEGSLFSAPNNVDAYLSGCYGNWHQLPPEKLRLNHGFSFNLNN